MSSLPTCEVCASYRQLPALAVARWATWSVDLTTPLCQEHLDAAFDAADEGYRLEPLLVHWLDGSRTLVAA